jgi:cyanophycinase
MTGVFLHGGGDNPEARSIAFGRFAQSYLTGVGGRPLLIVATAHAEADAQATAEYYRELFAGMSIPADWLIPLVVDSNRPLSAALMADHDPAGLFVCGGSTPLYHSALCTDLSWVDYLRERAIPYGGTSAGAVIAAEQAIIGGWQTIEDAPRPIVPEHVSEGLEPLTVRLGAGLVPFAVETHAGQAGTLTRLIQAVRRGLVREGWAIDEDTLLGIHPTRIQIHGRGHAYRVVRAAEGRVSVRIYPAPANYRRHRG